MHTLRDPDSIRAVLVVSEEGCLPPAHSPHSFCPHLSAPDPLFWVSASGIAIDISSFKAHPDRVAWDYDQDLMRSDILHGSGMIALRGGQLDTVIPLNARTMDADMAYLSSFLAQRAIPAQSAN